MDDASLLIPPLPDDPATLRQMLREQQAAVVVLLGQRDQARRQCDQAQQRHGELEHDHTQLEHEHAELQRRCQELARERDELAQARDANVADLLKERDAKIAQLTAERDKKVAELELEKLRLAHHLEMLKKRCYGPRADRLTLGQLLLDFAVELEKRPVNPQDLSLDAPLAAGKEGAADGRTLRRVKRGRRKLADNEHLPTLDAVHDLPEDQRLCADGHPMVKIGEEITWQVEFAPGFFYRLRHVQVRYGCATCERAGDNPQITLAEKPAQPIERGMAGPGLLAYVITSKFADYLPLYRLENIFARSGFEIDRSTMCLWAGDVADLVKPVYDRMVQRVLASHVIGTDDTVMPMLEVGKCRKARMWVYRGDEEHPYNVFDFTISRSRDGPAKFLKDYKGVLLADAYGGYEGICVEKEVIQAGCWAHARRKFVDSQSLAPEVTGPALELIGRLFGIEARAKGLSAAERLAVRQEKSVPVLGELAAKLPEWKAKLLPKHPVSGAVGYLVNQWKPLNVFAGDGAVAIDNNLGEQEMKRQALNRKNSLFVGNERGGRTAAVLSSLTSTCRRHGIDPQWYFTQLLTNLPSVPMSQVEQWLPDAWKQRQAQAGIVLPPRPALASVQAPVSR